MRSGVVTVERASVYQRVHHRVSRIIVLIFQCASSCIKNVALSPLYPLVIHAPGRVDTRWPAYHSAHGPYLRDDNGARGPPLLNVPSAAWRELIEFTKPMTGGRSRLNSSSAQEPVSGTKSISALMYQRYFPK